MTRAVSADEDVTLLLRRWRDGDDAALDRIVPVLRDELRRIARMRLRREDADASLQPTELVHEAYLRMVDQKRVDWNSRSHFLAIAATMMRRILVDRARKRRARARDAHVTLDLVRLAQPRAGFDAIAVDDALLDLARLDPRQAKIVEMRCFGGLSIGETAAALDVSAATVKRDWTVAKAWLARNLRRG